MAAVVAFAASTAWCVLALWLGPRIGFVDDPDRSDLTAHKTPAVPLGGVGLYIAIHVSMALASVFEPVLFVASTAVVLLGMADDRWDLPPMVRVVVEIGVATYMTVWAAAAGTSALVVVALILLAVIAINAVNLFDGLDGLVGLSALVTCAGFLWGAGTVDAGPILYLAAGLVGFLIFNWHPARIFLGDAGAYLIAVVFAYAVIAAEPATVFEALNLYALLGVFLIDLVASVIRRWRTRRPLLAGDRDHLYDQMRRMGFSVPRVALTSAVIQAMLVGVAVLAITWLAPILATAVIVLIAALVIVILGTAGLLGHRV